MRRRQAMALLGGALVCPLVARAEQLKRIGVLTGFSEGDSEGESLLEAFRQQLMSLGWIDDRNVHIDVRWGDGADPERMRASGVELARMMPDVIVVHGSRALAAVRKETDRIPIVFASVADPVASGYVGSLARPGGNVTGFTYYGGLPSPKLLEMLKEVAPNIKRVALVMTPDNPGFGRQLEAMEMSAESLGIKVASMPIRSLAKIAPTIEAFAQEPDAGLVVSSDTFMISHRDKIIAAAAQYRVPAAYADRSFVVAGGLFSYGVDRRERYRRVATYVHLILSGAKAGDLPVQQPVTFEFTLNIRTANALGLKVSKILRARADEVIE